MSPVPPETYEFIIYVAYVNADKTKPVLVIYNDGKLHSEQHLRNTEIQSLQHHASEADLEGRVVITRTISENVFHQFESSYTTNLVDGDATALGSAIDYLRQVHGQALDQFFVRCWKLAQAHQHDLFPQRFPSSE